MISMNRPKTESRPYEFLFKLITITRNDWRTFLIPI